MYELSDDDVNKAREALKVQGVGSFTLRGRQGPNAPT